MRVQRKYVLYIAGPFTAGHGRTEADNIEAAKRVVEKYFRLGFTTICPHTNLWHIERCEYEDYMEADFQLILRSDTVVMMPNWRESSGARREHEFAVKHGKRIVYERE